MIGQSVLAWPGTSGALDGAMWASVPPRLSSAHACLPRSRRPVLEMSDGVTVVVRRTIRPDATQAFEAWLRGVLVVASQFEGHGGVEVIRPAPGAASQDWVLVFRFDEAAQLEAWNASPERAEWLAKVEPMTLSVGIETVTGLEYWFTLPDDAAAVPPPRWKMATVTVVGLFPLVLWVAPLLGRVFGALPGPLATLATVVVMVGLMTWVVMPLLIRLFRPWLFPAPAPGGTPT